MSTRPKHYKRLFGFKTSAEQQVRNNKDLDEDDDSLFISTERPAKRRRHTSSLLSDHSDGLPYNSRESSIGQISRTESPSVTPAVGSKIMNNPDSPNGMMRPFDISGPAQSPSNAPATAPAPRSRKRKTTEAPRERETSSSGVVDRNATPAADKDSEDRDETDSFYQVYRRLLKSHQDQTEYFQNLHLQHGNALKRVQNVASRRKQRIEQLERENAAIRRSIATGTQEQLSALANSEQLSASSRTIEMLTKDLASWENKYTTSQQALRAISDDAATFERKYNVAQSAVAALSSQMEKLKQEVEEGKEGLKNGTKQLKGLQHILRKVDVTVVERVRELARLSVEWDRRGGADDRLRIRVSDEMGELVAAWRRFEGEYDEGVVGDSIESSG